MPIGPKGEKRPSDPFAAGIMAARVLVGDIEEEYAEQPTPTPSRAKGGEKGGKARAESLTPEQRSEIASRAARARWGADGEGMAAA